MPPARPRLIVNAVMLRGGAVLLARRSPHRKAYPGLWSSRAAMPRPGRARTPRWRGRCGRRSASPPASPPSGRHRRSRRDRALSHDAGDRLGRRRAAHHRPRTHRPALGAGRRGRGLAGISRWRRIGRCWPGCCPSEPRGRTSGPAPRGAGQAGDDGGRLRDLLAAPPGLEATLCDEVRHKGFKRPRAVPGGVVIRAAGRRSGAPIVGCAGQGACWPASPASGRSIWRSSTASRSGPVGQRAAGPTSPSPSKRSCTASRIYHSGAAAERHRHRHPATRSARRNPPMAWR